jgi:hypothetical protein
VDEDVIVEFVNALLVVNDNVADVNSETCFSKFDGLLSIIKSSSCFIRFEIGSLARKMKKNCGLIYYCHYQFYFSV